MYKLVCLISGLLTIAMVQPANAAKRLGPPIEDLQSTPDRVYIVVAEVREKPDDGMIRLTISKRLSGETPDEVLLRLDEQTLAEVETGRSYVVAWTDQRKSRREGWEADPDGASVVPVMGLGAAAVFEDTPELRFLFSPGTMADPATAGQQIDALLAQMQRKDTRSRGLVIAELSLREDLLAVMNPAQASLMQQVLQDPALTSQQRDLLLRAALLLPSNASSPWLAEEFRKTIIQQGTQYDLASFVPGLVRTAARGLQQVGEPEDIQLLSILLYSNNPGVAKAALAAMDHFDHVMATHKSEQALERGWVHSETRLALQRFLAEPAL